jgi:heme-degrading monooxygenase HmoA
MSNEIIEWAEFKLNEGVTEPELLAASRDLQHQFLNQQKGYIRRDLVQLGNRQYADLVVWESKECADSAMAIAAQHHACQAYFAMIQVDTAPKMGKPIQTDSHHQATYGIGGMEFSLFRLRQGADEKTLLTAAENMAAGLYADESGFIGHFIVRGGDGMYADVILATSGQRANELCQKWGTDPVSEYCQPYQALIDPSSVQLKFWDRVN